MEIKNYRYFHIIAMLFVSCLLIANTLAVKIIQIGQFSLPAGILCFPISYLINDVLTEIYGFEKTRSVIWWGFFCLALMSLLYYCAVLIKPAPFWQNQAAFSKLFGFAPRIAIASLIAFLIGSFLNSIVMSAMKVKTNGKHLWIRFVGSTIVGEGADSFVFNLIAFLGIFQLGQVLTIALSGFILKTLYEIVMIPFTSKIVSWLKKREDDKYDVGVKYSPFKI